jgi:bifunctional ADP-heptose synthase (sugar kinase/adenylyltransferase)
LIEAVRPDVLVATEDTYTPEQIATLSSGLCGRVEVMARMATISTSHRLWQVQTSSSDS